MVLPNVGLSVRCSVWAWLGLYLGASLVLGLPSLWLHFVGVSAILAIVLCFALPPPNIEAAHAILGPDPRNLDGSPSRMPSTMGLIAHRAAPLDAPENSLSGLRLAKQRGVRCVEIDVAFTKDMTAVVFHDDTVDRVTNGTGRIEDMTLEEVQQLDLAAKHVLKEEFSPERIPTLEEFVDEAVKLDVRLILDLKTYKQPEDTAKVILSMYEKHPSLTRSAMVSSFFPHLVYLIRRANPNIVAAMAWRPYFLSKATYEGILSEAKNRFDSPLYTALATIGDFILEWALHGYLWHFLGLSAVLVHRDSATLSYVQTWRERGVRVLAWTVNSSLQRIYLNRELRVTCLSDTLDQIPIKEFLSEEEKANNILESEA